jgi:hypothetical protein
MTTLAQYEEARAALAKATMVDEIVDIHDEVEHIKLYARQINDSLLLADASAFQVRVERRLGEVLLAAKETGEIRQGRQKSPGEGPFRPTLAELGVSKNLSSRAQKRASISEQAFENMIEGIRHRIASGHAKIINDKPEGSRATMGARFEPDDSLDYFPTPPWGTRALIETVLPQLNIRPEDLNTVWEPACGEGHMAEVLTEYFATVVASDIFDYGYGKVANFLETDDLCEWIITNPPFGKLTTAFTLAALERADNVAMFVQLRYLEGLDRYERIFSKRPPSLIAFFVERINLCKGRWEEDGTTATAYCWLVWIAGKSPRPPFWIPPGQRESLSHADDVERFTAHPVIKKPMAQAAE